MSNKIPGIINRTNPTATYLVLALTTLLSFGTIKVMSEGKKHLELVKNGCVNGFTHILQNQPRLDEKINEHFGMKIYKTPVENCSTLPAYAAAMYEKESHKIKIDSSTIFTHNSLNKLGFIAKNLFKNQGSEDLYLHEKSHTATFQIIDELIEDGTFDESHSDKNNNFYKFLTWEGIANYATVQLDEEKMPTNHKLQGSSWEEIGIENINTVYDYGTNIMKPIIDKLGITNAIKKIYSNPIITKDELKTPEKYIQRIIK